jgi:small subunit ribosomal protein S17
MAGVGARRRLFGTVISNQMDKTALILVERLTKHRTYKKILKRRAKYMAHDPQNQCQVGDKVRIVESRPLSKKKRWRVVEIVEKTVAQVE